MLWAGNDKISQWADANDFGSDGPAAERPASGLYLLRYPDDAVYVGYSANLDAYLTVHGIDPDAVRTRAESGSALDLRVSAATVVASATDAGLDVRNTPRTVENGHVSTDEEQQEWLLDPPAANRSDTADGAVYDAPTLARHADDFRHFESHPRHDEMVAALALYLDLCVPHPLRTESTVWTVNCHPGSSPSRLATLSMAHFDMFFLWQNEESGAIEAHFVVDERELPQLSFRARFKQWTELSEHAKRGPIGHISAGTFERTVVVDDIAHLAETFRQPGVARAAAVQALAVTRRHSSDHARAHCPQLAAAATAAMGTVRVETEPAPDAVGIGQCLDNLPTFTENPTVPASKSATVTFTDRERVDKVKALDPGGHALTWLAKFVSAALPHHDSDMAANWSLASLPTTSGNDGSQRLYVLNVAGIEVAYAVDRGDGSVQGHVVVSAADLEERTGRTIEQLRLDHPSFSFDAPGHTAAHGDDIAIGWSYGDTSLTELDELPWRDAGAVLVDRIRGQQCPYARYHSHALCEEVLSRAESLTVA